MKILLVDDHALFRDGIALVLERLGAPLELLEAGGGAEARACVALHRDLDLVLLDVALPDEDGLETLRALRQTAPEVPVVVLSALDGHAGISRALALGAQGYIPKSTSSDVMLGAVRLVLSGGLYLPPTLLDPEVTTPAAASAGVPLTVRQAEVLQLVTQGLPNKEIGVRLGIAESTVRVHVTALLKLLGVGNRTEASYEARRRGWVSY
jgi:DNA-binding NarL/FixJ family response regulator